MHLTTFIVALVFFLVAALLFGRGLVRIYQKNSEQARGLIGSGFMVGLLGVVIAAIIFNVFNL
jgi:FtsH-binding integral membrane protein